MSDTVDVYVEPITVVLTVHRRPPRMGERGWWYDAGASLADVANNALAESVDSDDGLPGWRAPRDYTEVIDYDSDGDYPYTLTFELLGHDEETLVREIRRVCVEELGAGQPLDRPDDLFWLDRHPGETHDQMLLRLYRAECTVARNRGERPTLRRICQVLVHG